jgi:arsenite-transporting ATPase
MRIIVFCGNGGSGVSTVAAATACALAQSGKRTLAFGITRGLGAALGHDLGLEPVEVAARLDAVEGHGGHGGPDEFRAWLQGLMDWRGMDPDLADDLAALPGVNHIGRLLEWQRLVRSEAYDCAVLDGAEVSQFLDLPGALEAAARWLERLFSPRQQTVFEPFFRAFAGDYASAGDSVFENGRDLLSRLADVRDMLTDPEVTSVRLVVVPGKAALSAVQDGASVLGLFGYNLDAVIANRLLPEAVTDPFFDQSRAAQQAAMEDLIGIGISAPILEAKLQPERPQNPAALLQLATQVYGSEDPASFLVERVDHSVERTGDQYIVLVNAPFAKREELRLEEVDEGIAVHLNGRRCVIALPDVLYTEASSWSYDGEVLKVVLDR